jgi:hypothetical protein
MTQGYLIELKRCVKVCYLGAHTEFSAQLLDVFICNNSAVAIEYKKSAKGILLQSKRPIANTQAMMEVFEMVKSLLFATIRSEIHTRNSIRPKYSKLLLVLRCI